VTGTVTTENSRVRSAPSTSAAIVARLNKGDQVKIVGRTTASDWWEIPLPSDPNARGWISADLIQVKGSTDTLPVVQPNAPPTPQPYPRP
jgi:N-acetylmuramoyl-L-alanine amidase